MKRTVLVVDDEPKVLGALSRCFANAEIHSDTCSSAEEAVSFLLDRSYDCIISDYKMPGMDGLEFLEIASELAASTPRLLLSGEVDLEILERAINDCKIDKFVNKPWSNDAMITAVEDSVRDNEAHRRLESKIAKTNEQITKASKLQARKLPQPISNRMVTVDLFFKPLEELSGDFLDFRQSNHQFDFAIFDSAGHGPAAAMEAYALQDQVVFDQAVSTQAFVESLNTKCSNKKHTTLFTMSVGKIDFDTDVLKLCQAGAPSIYLIPADAHRAIEQIGLGGLPVGYSKEASFEEASYTLSPNDRLVGFSESFSDEDTFALESKLQSVRDMDVVSLKQVVKDWCKEIDQKDDVSALFLCYRPTDYEFLSE